MNCLLFCTEVTSAWTVLVLARGAKSTLRSAAAGAGFGLATETKASFCLSCNWDLDLDLDFIKITFLFGGGDVDFRILFSPELLLLLLFLCCFDGCSPGGSYLQCMDFASVTDGG